MSWLDRLKGRPRDAPAPAPPPPPANGEDYTLDELLAPHREAIAAAALPQVDIEATVVPADQASGLEPDGMEARASKFGGVPFLPAGAHWPQEKSGVRMGFVAQVNFAEVPPLPGFPREGILQAFESDEMTSEPGNAFGVVRFFDAERARAPHVPPGPGRHGEHDSVRRPHRLSFAPGTSAGSAYDVAFEKVLTDLGLGKLYAYGAARDDRYDLAGEELSDDYRATGHHLGGYAAFTQSDPRKPADPDVHVLQIDSIGDIMFGDVGIAHVFIPRDALATGDWSRAYYYWDCS